MPQTQIIDIVTGVHPRELIFKDRATAERWLESYRVSQAYKDEHYRIIELPEPKDCPKSIFAD